MIEAEFHANWKSPEDEVVDITPKPESGINRMLFIPDSSRKYEGKRVQSIREPLTEDSAVAEFIAASWNYERLTGDIVGVNIVKNTREWRDARRKFQRTADVMNAKY